MTKPFKQAFVLILAGVLLSTSVQAATMHAVLIGDSNDTQLGAGFKESVKAMHAEMAKMARFAAMEYRPVILLGNESTVSNVLEAIDSLDVEENDTIVLYMTMHGYRTVSKDTINHWPNLYFSNERNGADYWHFFERALMKNSRLLIVMADACNSYFPENAIPTQMALKALSIFMADDTLRILNAKRLFLETSGQILITSSTPGQFSWGSQAHGGVMTVELLKELNSGLTRHEFYSWDELLQNTFLKMIELFEIGYLPEEQVPIYEIYD